jgi:hypothetical protein
LRIDSGDPRRSDQCDDLAAMVPDTTMIVIAERVYRVRSVELS